jgi:hypothetical protein
MAIDVVVSKDGQTGLLVERHAGRIIDSPATAGDVYVVKPSADATEKALVLITGWVWNLGDYDHLFTQFDPSLVVRGVRDEAALALIGDYLDQHGMPAFTPRSGSEFAFIEAHGEPVTALMAGDRPHAADGQVYGYAAAKLLWVARFHLDETSFTAADHLRLNVPPGRIESVARRGEDAFWLKEGDNPAKYRPTGRFLRDVDANRFPALSKSPVFLVRERLQAPRYRPVREHYDKALDKMTEQNWDPENAVKEVVVALESMARILLETDKGTLGDYIDELRN